MKFRRNLKEEKLFRIVGVAALLLLAYFLISYIASRNNSFRLFSPLLLVPPLDFALVYYFKHSYVEFQKEKILLISTWTPNVEISIVDIETIMIPSEKALKRDNAIIFKRKDIANIISYAPEIEKYIVENIDVPITRYDNCSKAMKNAGK